jgi:hypothetical protein
MKSVIAALALGLSVLAPPVQAGQAGDVLSRCLVDSATQDDRRALVRWIFSAISVHPDLKELSTVDAGKRDELELAAAAVFGRLLAQDCTAQAREAIVSEGTDGYSNAFKTLGELAMGGVVEQAEVTVGMTHLASRIDGQRVMKALLSK